VNPSWVGTCWERCPGFRVVAGYGSERFGHINQIRGVERMARRPNYGGEKRQKEIQKQKKKEEKAEKKRLKKEAALTGDVDGLEDGLEDGVEETDAADADGDDDDDDVDGGELDVRH
jgi:hypothetical protein